MKLASNLKRILRDRNLTASALARGCKLPPTTLANWAAGMPPRNVVQLRTVAQFLGLTIEELVFGDVVKTGQQEISAKQIFEDDIFIGEFEVVLRKIKK